jgi:hypothetical protein
VFVVRHTDGRVVVFAKDHGLKPMELVKDQWRPCSLTGEQLQDFVRLGAAEAQAFLVKAKSAAAEMGHPRQTIGTAPAGFAAGRATAAPLPVAQPSLGPNKD